MFNETLFNLARIYKYNKQTNDMKTSVKINPKAEKIFRNENAIALYNTKSNKLGCYESGVDNKGMIYFAFSSGSVERFSTAIFIAIMVALRMLTSSITL